jgi:hypothetical protein
LPQTPFLIVTNEWSGSEAQDNCEIKIHVQRRIAMETKKNLWFGALLIGSMLLFPPAIYAAEKGGPMEKEKEGMMKDEKDKMMKEKDKSKMAEDKMKMDDKMKTDEKMKMDEKKK